ncbi:MAG: hypothetical protein ACXW3O_12950, partial [Brevundimonas sp.]
ARLTRGQAAVVLFGEAGRAAGDQVAVPVAAEIDHGAAVAGLEDLTLGIAAELAAVVAAVIAVVAPAVVAAAILKLAGFAADVGDAHVGPAIAVAAIAAVVVTTVSTIAAVVVAAAVSTIAAVVIAAAIAAFLLVAAFSIAAGVGQNRRGGGKGEDEDGGGRDKLVHVTLFRFPDITWAAGGCSAYGAAEPDQSSGAGPSGWSPGGGSSVRASSSSTGYGTMKSAGLARPKSCRVCR